MSLITDKFKRVAEDQKVQFKERDLSKPLKDKNGNEVEQTQKIFQSGLKLKEDKVIPCSTIIQDLPADRVNYQITYSRIGYVSDRNKMPDILMKLNELNTVRTGYYFLAISKDGELFMRHLGIVGEDVRPLVNTFVYGGRIIRNLFPELEQIDGIDFTQRDN